MMKFTFLLCFTLLLKFASPYSSGAPDAACGDMTPQHGRTPQTSSSPYSIKPTSTTVEGGERLLIEIEGKQDFVGFFIQAHNSNDKPVGTFFTSNYKTTTCGQGFNNAITHSNSDAKRKITMEWEAPQDFEGDVVFKASMVQSSPVYWVGVPSPKVKVVKGSPLLRSKESDSARSGGGVRATIGAAAPPAPEQLESKDRLEKIIENMYEECGQSKTCFGIEKNCVKKKKCKTLVTYTRDGSGKYEFELLGERRGGSQYLSVGLSDDANMGDDAVVSCTSNNENQFEVKHSWNNGRTNLAVAEDKSGLSTLMTGFTDKKMYCKFIRDAVTRINRKTFDLDSNTYHVLIAAGPMTASGSLMHHGQDRKATNNFVALGLTSKSVEGSNDSLFKIIHASLMIGAWIGAASCGIIFARYFKKTWLNYKCMKIDQWFHMHRFFMILTWCLTVAAIILIAIALRDFVPSTHAFCGVASALLCFIQPFMAVFRCAPTTSKRKIFNWFHWLVGNAAQIIGVAAIFLGFELFFASGDETICLKYLAYYIIIGFIAFHILIHLLLTFTQCMSDCKHTKEEESFPMKEMGDSRMALQSEPVHQDAPMGCLRKFFLAIYLPINWIVTAVLILLVVFPNDTIIETMDDWKINYCKDFSLNKTLIP